MIEFHRDARTSAFQATGFVKQEFTLVYIRLPPVPPRLQDDGRRRYEEPRRHGVGFRVQGLQSLGFRVGFEDSDWVEVNHIL